jgi:head-tail adaptor
MQYKQEANELTTTKKWRDNHKIWAEYKGKPRKEAVANFRLRTGHDCLAAHLRKTGIYESSECTIC